MGLLLGSAVVAAGLRAVGRLESCSFAAAQPQARLVLALPAGMWGAFKGTAWQGRAGSCK